MVDSTSFIHPIKPKKPKPAGAPSLHPAKGKSTKDKDQKSLAMRKPNWL